MLQQEQIPKLMSASQKELALQNNTSTHHFICTTELADGCNTTSAILKSGLRMPAIAQSPFLHQTVPEKQ
jgi:hypothetical protein